MYRFVILLVFLIICLKSTYASEIIINTTGKAEISGITFKDESKFRLYKSNGHWKSSSGDYGLHKCYGTLVNDSNNEAQFEVYCKYTSQENEYFILKIVRDTEYQESGLGKATIIETSKKYMFFINAECKHAITYIDQDYFALQKCNY